MNLTITGAPIGFGRGIFARAPNVSTSGATTSRGSRLQDTGSSPIWRDARAEHVILGMSGGLGWAEWINCPARRALIPQGLSQGDVRCRNPLNRIGRQKAPNHALQRTGAAVTPAASGLRLSPHAAATPVVELGVVRPVRAICLSHDACCWTSFSRVSSSASLWIASLHHDEKARRKHSAGFFVCGGAFER